MKIILLPFIGIIALQTYFVSGDYVEATYLKSYIENLYESGTDSHVDDLTKTIVEKYKDFYSQINTSFQNINNVLKSELKNEALCETTENTVLVNKYKKLVFRVFQNFCKDVFSKVENKIFNENDVDDIKEQFRETLEYHVESHKKFGEEIAEDVRGYSGSYVTDMYERMISSDTPFLISELAKISYTDKGVSSVDLEKYIDGLKTEIPESRKELINDITHEIKSTYKYYLRNFRERYLFVEGDAIFAKINLDYVDEDYFRKFINILPEFGRKHFEAIKNFSKYLLENIKSNEKLDVNVQQLEKVLRDFDESKKDEVFDISVKFINVLEDVASSERPVRFNFNQIQKLLNDYSKDLYKTPLWSNK